MPAWFGITLTIAVVLMLVIGWVRIVHSDQREARNYRAYLEVGRLQHQVSALLEQTGTIVPQPDHDDAET